MSIAFKERLVNEFKKEGFNLENNQIEKFLIYRNFLLEYNEKVNLTAITDDKGIITKHFLDSALMIKYLKGENLRMIDIGSGAGFPAIPVKILRPDIEITMIDGLNKRIIFLNQLMERLEIQGLALHLRGEDCGRDKKYREKFDVATARAVTGLRELVEISLPFLKIGGCFLALKGKIDIELEEAKPTIEALGGVLSEIKRYYLMKDQERSIIIIKKVKVTKEKYPRLWGKIKSTPIL